ncbi:MAG: hypothetical protein WD512_18510 [Candidatus Paceibacterota bacterium]
MYFLLIIVFIVIAGGLTIYLFYTLSFKIKIVLFKKLGAHFIPVGTDRGKFERISITGDYWLSTRKFKKKLPRPKLLAGKNTYWYVEREDGEWINFLLGDIDFQMKSANAYYVEEDMRLQRLGIAKNLRENFKKQTFWQQYGSTLVMAGTILIMVVCLVVLFQKMSGLWDQMTVTAQAIQHMAQSVDNVATRTGGGVILAP